MSDINSEVTPDVVYALRQYRANWWKSHHYPQPTLGDPTTDDEMRDLLIFAARLVQQRPDPSLPQTLEGLRVIHLVPESVGAALFERAEEAAK